MGDVKHSVRLDREKCIGCTNCVRHCPTEAIRIRGGKAKIITERCIDCGECVRICPQHAKTVKYDRIADVMPKYKYKVALVAPSFLGQFNNLDSVGYLSSALKKMGFDKVFEVARAAEIISDYTRVYLDKNKDKFPVISSACPVVVRLIRERFPSLIPHILPIVTPVELAAKMARNEVMRKTGLAAEDIGCIFISPCPAKITAAKEPFFTESSGIDEVLSMRKVYLKVLPLMSRDEEDEDPLESGIIGISWAASGGEASALLREQYLAADGISNVIKVLAEMENDKLDGLEFVELNACTGGCVGGVLTVENPFVARTRIHNLRKYMPISRNFYSSENADMANLESDKILDEIQSLNLGDDPAQALARMNRIDELCEALPGFDCGSCGAPTCRALAEDAVLGFASIEDCIFRGEAQKAGLFNEKQEESVRFKENDI